ncbi:MAG TPA: hypothetical protein VEA58_14270, partial [Anaerovoracaceae bacterium]|nr:hypothetical protein [Anaerovoracaceae bacterium]
ELQKFACDFNLNIYECAIYIDLMEYYGIFQPFLFEWNFTRVKNQITNKVKQVILNELPSQHKDMLKGYYKSRWSIFSESCMTTDDKLELFTSILRESVYDGTHADHIYHSFKNRLLYAIQGGKSYVWNETETK